MGATEDVLSASTRFRNQVEETTSGINARRIIRVCTHLRRDGEAALSQRELEPPPFARAVDCIQSRNEAVEQERLDGPIGLEASNL